MDPGGVRSTRARASRRRSAFPASRACRRVATTRSLRSDLHRSRRMTQRFRRLPPPADRLRVLRLSETSKSEGLQMRVGFIGLGRMGGGMARRLLEAGHELSVFDVVAAQTAPFAAAGARVAKSVAELAAGSEIVVTMLVEDAIVAQAALGPGGLASALGAGATHLVMRTHAVAAVPRPGRKQP